MAFAVGSTLRLREVWDGATWLEMPQSVVADDGEVLATLLTDGTPFTFPPHHGVAHPWSAHDAWRGPTVLQLRRARQWYSVWRFHGADGAFLHWYVNFERPYLRTADGIDVDDLELDLVIAPDGTRSWKDVEHLADRLDERRFSTEDLLTVLRTAREVTDLLDRDDPGERWWAPWDDWAPGGGRIGG